MNPDALISAFASSSSVFASASHAIRSSSRVSSGSFSASTSFGNTFTVLSLMYADITTPISFGKIVAKYFAIACTIIASSIFGMSA